VTGDKHLLALKEFSGIGITKIAGFLYALRLSEGLRGTQNLSKNSSFVITLNLFQGLPELTSGLQQIQHDILQCIISFLDRLHILP
jgi:hypothetical protein